MSRSLSTFALRCEGRYSQYDVVGESEGALPSPVFPGIDEVVDKMSRWYR